MAEEDVAVISCAGMPPPKSKMVGVACMPSEKVAVTFTVSAEETKLSASLSVKTTVGGVKSITKVTLLVALLYPFPARSEPLKTKGYEVPSTKG